MQEHDSIINIQRSSNATILLHRHPAYMPPLCLETSPKHMHPGIKKQERKKT